MKTRSSNEDLLNTLDDMFGYYLCECGHYATQHFMDAPPNYQMCCVEGCKCKRFRLKPKDKEVLL